MSVTAHPFEVLAVMRLGGFVQKGVLTRTAVACLVAQTA